MDWILALALATFALVIVFLAWNWMSTRRRQHTGGRTAGFGGPGDPLSGSAEGIRSPDAIRASLHDPTHRERERVREEP